MQRSLSFRLGAIADRAAVKNGSEAPDEHRHALQSYRARSTIRTTSRRIMGNLSFALLMLVLAVCAVFVYILILHG